MQVYTISNPSIDVTNMDGKGGWHRRVYMERPGRRIEVQVSEAFNYDAEMESLDPKERISNSM